MDVISISAKAILPLFAYMALGYHCKLQKLLHKTTAKELNVLCFKYFLSTYSAYTIYKADLKNDIDAGPVLFVVISLVSVFLISWFVVTRFEKDSKTIPTIIQGIYKANVAILGVPIGASLSGGKDMGTVSVIMAAVVPVNNFLSAYIFERYTGKASSKLDLIKKILKNPLILGSLIGLGLNIIKFPIPTWIQTDIIAKIGGLTTPMSLIALGASFEFAAVKKYAKKITWATLGKLVFMPAVLIPTAILMGFRSTNLLTIMVFACAPNAVNSYSTAVALGGDADLANEIVVMSSLFSLITMFAWFCAVGFIVGF